MTHADSTGPEETAGRDELLRALAELVDQDYYYAAYPDVREAGVPALAHYLRHGWQEERRASARFKLDPLFYARQFPGLSLANGNLLEHYLRIGRHKGALTEEPAMILSGHDGIRQEPRAAALPGNREDGCRVVAWYLPQFHPIGENDLSWGKGFTEWSTVAAAAPRFKGHYQPRLPGALGFYDLRRKETVEEQIGLARHAGIYGFCLHHYWFFGKKILRTPLEHWRRNPDLDFPFCLHWANEPWTRRWDGSERNVLIPQRHSPEDSLLFFRDIEWALNDPRYMRFQGKPILGVYRPALFGDIKATLTVWRRQAQSVGIGELFLFASRSFECTPAQALKDGFDGVVEFPPHSANTESKNHLYRHRSIHYLGRVMSYPETRDDYLAKRQVPYHAPVFRGLMPDWDNSARSDIGRIYDGATPEEYGEWLKRTLELARRDAYDGEKYIFINAWNEWGEGAYLEPDAKHGFAVLNATADALDRAPRLPHAVFVCDIEDERQSARLEALLRENQAKPVFRPLIYSPRPVHSTGSFKGLAPVFASLAPDGLRPALGRAGYFSWAIRFFLDAGLAEQTGEAIWPEEARVVYADAEGANLDPACWIVETAGRGEGPARWTLRRKADGRRTSLALLLRRAAAVEAKILLTALVLPSGSGFAAAGALAAAQRQSSFDMEIYMPEELAGNCRNRFTRLRALPCPTEAGYLDAALREAEGEFIWPVAPEDTPRPVLPATLLPVFTDGNILCARSYERKEDDCLPQIFAKHSYRLNGAQLAAAARAGKYPLISSPTCSLFRKSALLEALDACESQAATALDMLRELAQNVYEKGDVGLVPARLTEYGESRK